MDRADNDGERSYPQIPRNWFPTLREPGSPPEGLLHNYREIMDALPGGSAGNHVRSLSA